MVTRGNRTGSLGRMHCVRRFSALTLIAVLAASACTNDSAREREAIDRSPPAPGISSSPSPVTTSPRPASMTVLARGLQAPWGLAFLPDGSALISERDTRVIKQLRPDGSVRIVQWVSEADASGEGGLLGIAVSSTYAQDLLVYAYYTTADDNRIARFKIGERPRPILTGIPVSGIHNGGRLAFGPDGFLYAGTGDAAERGRSQDRSSLGGKVLRMTAEGRPAPGNPFPNSVVWSVGHRNVQGLAWDNRDRLFAPEFGQNRFDEVNRITPGGNYGWPDVEGRGGSSRFIEPLITWRTRDASPSGAAILDQTLYVACLRGERLYQVPIDSGGRLGTPKALLVGQYGRLRHVAVAPDGSLWILTSNRDGRGDPIDSDDRVLRLVTASA